MRCETLNGCGVIGDVIFQILPYSIAVSQCGLPFPQVEGMRDTHKDALRNHVMRDGPIDYTAIGLPDDDNGRATLKEYCNPEDVELPFLSGKKDDIMELRKLLESSGYQIKPFPQVTGKIQTCMQEVVLGLKEALNIKEINTNPKFYNGWTITIEQGDKEGTATVVEYKGGDKRVAVIQPALDFEFEMGSAIFTLKQDGFKNVQGTIGFHSFSKQHQVFSLGPADKNEEFDWELKGAEGFYNGYTIEVKTGKTLVGVQRVYEYWPQTRKVILEGPLRLPTGKSLVGGLLKDAEIKPIAGESTYTIFPDNLIPPPRRVHGSNSGVAQPKVAPSVMATPKNVVGAPKGSVAATRNVKSKINKLKAFQKKTKGGGSSCVVM